VGYQGCIAVHEITSDEILLITDYRLEIAPAKDQNATDKLQSVAKAQSSTPLIPKPSTVKNAVRVLFIYPKKLSPLRSTFL
jgi:hypothetical protein